MMKRFQVKCRRCRHWLMAEDSIVDCHGNAVQGDVASWDCGEQQERNTHTHLFVSSSLPPPFILNAVEEACYTQGKINCPKCQGRLGSFDFVRTSRTCACGRTPLPPIHLLRDRIDFLPSQFDDLLPSPVIPASHARLAMMPDVHSLRGTSALHGPQEEGVVNRTEDSAIGAAGTSVVVESLSPAVRESQRTEETARNMAAMETVARNMAAMEIVAPEENGSAGESAVGGENEGSDEDAIIVNLGWLFGQSAPPPQQEGSVSVNAHSVEGRSAVDADSEQCSYTCVCLGEERSSISLLSGNEPHSCTATLSSADSTPQGAAKDVVLGSRKVIRPVPPRGRDCADSTTGLDLVLQRPGPVRGPSRLVAATFRQDSMLCALSKKERRERRRKRNRGRDSSELDGVISPDASHSPVHRSSARPQLLTSPCQREREKREWELGERRQVQEEDLEWDHTCPMCLDVMWCPHSTLPCRHNFCQGCLQRLTTVTSSDRCDCPLCRHRIAQCVPNADMEAIIRDKYPAHLRARRREERRRHARRFKHSPLPGLPFPQSLLCRFPDPRGARGFLRLTPASKRRLAVVVVSVLVVVALSSLGLEICKRVLGRLATVYDDLTERLTGERLWSRFLGVESRMLTVSCVFVLYLLVACAVHYLHLFQYVHN